MFLEKALSFSEKGCSLFEETSYAFSENIGRLFFVLLLFQKWNELYEEERSGF